MKKLMLMTAMGAACMAASAQTTQTMEEVRVSGAQARIEYPADMRNLWVDEFDKVKGTYYLSNGKSMHLSMWGNRMYAKIDGMNKVPLLAASPYVFVARNLQMKIMIDDPDATTGDINATVMLAAPRLTSTQPAAGFVTLIARR
jgi:hypothetical protein